MLIKIYDRIIEKCEGTLIETRVRCETYEEWCDLYAFARSIGYDFIGSKADVATWYVNLWFNGKYSMYLVFVNGDKRTLLYGHRIAVPRLINTDLYDIIYPPMDVMAILEC